MSLLSKKDKKYFLLIILFSLIHNFIVFPAQAAEEYNNIDIVTNNQTAVIKKPNSSINRFEEIGNKKVSQLSAVNNFKIAKNPKDDKSSDFSIDLIADNHITDDSNYNAKTVSLTAYTSESSQTDDDPCTTANGFNLCNHNTEDSVAANFLPFGTKIMIPEIFGDKVFIVRDRMHKRFSNRVDIWMANKDNAIKFGVRQAKIIILQD